MFLDDQDFESNVDLTALQIKRDQIQAFTASLFLDIREQERESYLAFKERFEALKTTLFLNSDQILESAKLTTNPSERQAIKEAQINLMFAWEQFGLTEDMYLKIYQCHRNQHSNNYQSKERALLLSEILGIQTDLLLLFKIRQGIP
ncbi:MAG: hypothetical protein RL184_662 [Pseudomonadota bacterium]|jgi:hypothetical protein